MKACEWTGKSEIAYATRRRKHLARYLRGATWLRVEIELTFLRFAGFLTL